jgi:hypothetical protein
MTRTTGNHDAMPTERMPSERMPAERMPTERMPRRAGRRSRSRGQSLVEFAISFPVVMLMILFGVDFGRVFFGWLTLSNAVREGANYAAINPAAWSTSNAEGIAEYARLITTEAGGDACTLPSTIPSPAFPSGSSIGSPAVVSITCRFSLITPLMTNILGGGVNVSASASFPIRSGVLGGSGFSAGLPSFVPSATGSSGGSGSGGSGSGGSGSGGSGSGGSGSGSSPSPTATPFPTPSAIITPVPTCLVPDLTNVNSSQATRKWTDAGFSANNLTFSPLVPPHFKIKHQTPFSPGASVTCTSTMTVTP